MKAGGPFFNNTERISTMKKTINARIALAVDKNGRIAASRYKSPHGDTVQDCVKYFSKSCHDRLTGPIEYYLVECTVPVPSPEPSHTTITACATLQEPDEKKVK